MERPISIVKFVQCGCYLFAAGLSVCLPTAMAEHPGMAVYREHCSHCHGESGQGTEDYPAPLAGSLSLNQLAAYIDKTMPEDDPLAGDR